MPKHNGGVLIQRAFLIFSCARQLCPAEALFISSSKLEATFKGLQGTSVTGVGLGNQHWEAIQVAWVSRLGLSAFGLRRAVEIHGVRLLDEYKISAI